MSGAVGAVTSVNAVTWEFEQLVHKNTSSYMYVVLNLFVIQHKIALLKKWLYFIQLGIAMLWTTDEGQGINKNYDCKLCLYV